MPASACVLLPEEKINNGALFFSEAGLADLAMDIPKAGGNSDRGMGDRGKKFTGPHSSVPSGGLADFILCGSCILWLKIFAFSAFFCAKAVSINHIAIFFPKSCGGRHVLGGKSGGGPSQSTALRAHASHRPSRQRLGLRQPSGALVRAKQRTPVSHDALCLL
jgi:hypothetical protein